MDRSITFFVTPERVHEKHINLLLKIYNNKISQIYYLVFVINLKSSTFENEVKSLKCYLLIEFPSRIEFARGKKNAVHSKLFVHNVLVLPHSPPGHRWLLISFLLLFFCDTDNKDRNGNGMACSTCHNNRVVEAERVTGFILGITRSHTDIYVE